MHPLGGKPKRIKFGTYDLETKDGDKQEAGFTRPFLGALCLNGGVSYYWSDAETIARNHWSEAWWKTGGCITNLLADILTVENNGYWFYAHNAGRFDALFMLKGILENKFEKPGYYDDVRIEKLIVSASTILAFDVTQRSRSKKRPHLRWKFVDSVQLLPARLDKLGEDFGFGGKEDHDLNLPENRRHQWQKYIARDVVLLSNILEKFFDLVYTTFNGEVAITAASTAMKTYRRAYQPHAFWRNSPTHELVRRGFYGGRTENFHLKGSNVRYYDINSSYPASMMHRMPTYMARIIDGAEGFGDERAKRQREVAFLEVSVYIPPSTHIPALPHRHGKGASEKLLFPAGTFSGVWDWHELSAAIVYGGARIIAIKTGVVYSSEKVFGRYVDTMYDQKRAAKAKGDGALEAVSKLFMNALFGKFGQKAEKTAYHIGQFEDIPEDFYTLPDFGPITPIDSPIEVYTASKEMDSAHMIPQIAAHITALSRVRLYLAIQIALQRGGEVFYCDTDSIIASVPIEPESGKLGEWKDEIPGVQGGQGWFYGPKAYIIRDGEGKALMAKAKGFPFVRDTEARAKLITDLHEHGYVHEFKSLERVCSLLRAGYGAGPQMKPRTKSVRNASQKRVFSEDGRSRPIVLDEPIPEDYRLVDEDEHITFERYARESLGLAFQSECKILNELGSFKKRA